MQRLQENCATCGLLSHGVVGTSIPNSQLPVGAAAVNQTWCVDKPLGHPSLGQGGVAGRTR